jgi:hypothetical protein
LTKQGSSFNRILGALAAFIRNHLVRVYKINEADISRYYNLSERHYESQSQNEVQMCIMECSFSTSRDYNKHVDDIEHLPGDLHSLRLHGTSQGIDIDSWKEEINSWMSFRLGVSEEEVAQGPINYWMQKKRDEEAKKEAETLLFGFFPAFNKHSPLSLLSKPAGDDLIRCITGKPEVVMGQMPTQSMAITVAYKQMSTSSDPAHSFEVNIKFSLKFMRFDDLPSQLFDKIRDLFIIFEGYAETENLLITQIETLDPNATGIGDRQSASITLKGLTQEQVEFLQGFNIPETKQIEDFTKEIDIRVENARQKYNQILNLNHLLIINLQKDIRAMVEQLHAKLIPYLPTPNAVPRKIDPQIFTISRYINELISALYYDNDFFIKNDFRTVLQLYYNEIKQMDRYVCLCADLAYKSYTGSVFTSLVEITTPVCRAMSRKYGSQLTLCSRSLKLWIDAGRTLTFGTELNHPMLKALSCCINEFSGKAVFFSSASICQILDFENQRQNREELKKQLQKYEDLSNVFDDNTKDMTPADLFWLIPKQEIDKLYHEIFETGRIKLFNFKIERDSETKIQEMNLLHEMPEVRSILEMIMRRSPVVTEKLPRPGAASCEMWQLYKKYADDINKCINGTADEADEAQGRLKQKDDLQSAFRRQTICTMLATYVATTILGLDSVKGISVWLYFYKMGLEDVIVYDNDKKGLASVAQMVRNLQAINLTTIQVPPFKQNLTEDEYLEQMGVLIAPRILSRIDARLEFLCNIKQYQKDALELRQRVELYKQSHHPFVVNADEISENKVEHLYKAYAKVGVLRIEQNCSSTHSLH